MYINRRRYFAIKRNTWLQHSVINGGGNYSLFSDKHFIDIISKKNLKSQKYLDFYGQKYLGTLNKVKNGLNNYNYGKFWPNWTFGIKKIEKNEKNDSNQNFQIAISQAWKGFQTPSKGLIDKNYLKKITQRQFLKIFKIWALQVKFSEKNAFFGGFLCCVILTDHIFGIP